MKTLPSPKPGQIWSYRTPGSDLCETGPLFEVTDVAVRWFDNDCSLCVLNRNCLVALLRDECSAEEDETFPGDRVKRIRPDAGPAHYDIASAYPESMRSNVPPVCPEENLGVTKLQEQILSFQSSPHPKVYKIQLSSLYGKFGTPEKRSFWKKLSRFLRTFFSSLSISGRVGPIGAFRNAKAWAYPRPLKIINALEGARRFQSSMLEDIPEPSPQIGDRWSYALDDGSFGETASLVGIEGQNVLWIDEQGAGCTVPVSALVQRLLSPRKGEYWTYVRGDGSFGLSFPIDEIHSDGVEWIEESDWSRPRVPFSKLIERVPDDVALSAHRQSNRNKRN